MATSPLPDLSAGAVLGLSPHRLFAAPPPLALPAGQADLALVARVEARLRALRQGGRRSVAIVDLACGGGADLVAAARAACRLGFVAIEAKGFDADPAAIEQAWERAMARRHAAVGYGFLVRAGGGPLPFDEGEADLVIGAADDPECTRVATVPAAIISRGEGCHAG